MPIQTRTSRWRPTLVVLSLVVLVLGLQAQEPQRGPLTLVEVTALLEGGMPVAGIGDGARDFGVDFQFTDTVEDTLRAAGATEALLNTLRGLPAVLRVTSDPAGADVWVDDQPQGQTPLSLDDWPPARPSPSSSSAK